MTMAKEATPSAPPRPKWWKSDKAVIAYVFLAPYIILFTIFRIIPTCLGMFLSITNWKISGDYDIVGTANFERLFADPLFWNGLRVTLVYALIAIPLTVTISMGMALLCNKAVRGIGFYRSVYFLPVVTSAVMSGIVFIWMFGHEGPINAALGAVGLPAVGWLQSEALVLPSLALVSAWQNFGYDMLILLAGLLAIPKDYYEAANLDGASGPRQFWHITLPLVRPALFFVVVLEIIRAFQVFDTIYVMTGGGPVRASYSLTYMIYDQGFGYFDFGYASAAGVVLLVLTLIVSLVQRRWLGKAE